MSIAASSRNTAPKIVMIGGGTGSFTLLSTLKHYAKNITSIVNMVDDGGSTGMLRDELGVLPPGDVRQCIVALSNAPMAMRELFNYRFPSGKLKGHSFGNLFLTAVEKQTDNFAEAVEMASRVLNITGKVVPVTLDKTTLVLKDSGRTIKGEYKIGHAKLKKQRPEISLKPKASINPEARKAILEADLIVIAPGNLYGSIAPALIVDGVRQAILESDAKLVDVVNLVTKPGQTDGFSVNDFVMETERFIAPGRVDYALYNNKKPPKELLKKYTEDGEYPVKFDTKVLEKAHFKAIGDDFLSRAASAKKVDKTIRRTLIRHNSEKVARHIMRIFYS